MKSSKMISLIKLFSLFFLLILTNQCSENKNEKVSKGHREAIANECSEDRDKKLCGLEVRKSFIESGNDFVNFEDLNKDQTKRVQMECVRSRKFGLVTYNDCLAKFKEVALNDGLTQDKIPKQPKNNIEKLETSVVYIAITEYDKTTKKEKGLTSGSGIILNKNLIATNCHVTVVAEEGPDRHIFINNISNKDKWALANIYKKNPAKDICILKYQPEKDFTIDMVPVKKIKNFSELKRGDFVRTMGSPNGLVGHTATGSINFLGQAPEEILKDFDEDTKFIIHDATIDEGSSGGPLFDSDGNLIGINTFYFGNNFYSVSSDHIKELLKD